MDTRPLAERLLYTITPNMDTRCSAERVRRSSFSISNLANCSAFVIIAAGLSLLTVVLIDRFNEGLTH